MGNNFENSPVGIHVQERKVSLTEDEK